MITSVHCCAFNCTIWNTVSVRKTTGIKFYRFPTLHSTPCCLIQWRRIVTTSTYAL